MAVAGSAQAQMEAADPATPITDTLADEFDAMLTPAAAKLTEGDAVLLNQHLMDPSTPLPDSLAHLTLADVDSLMAAFHASAKGSYSIASLAPSLVGTAFAASCCCTCTPASCCCAAAQAKPSRSRLIA
jgi:hypothetical protein